MIYPEWLGVEGQGPHMEVKETQQRLIGVFAALLAAPSAILWWRLLPRIVFNRRLFAIYFVLFISGVTVYFLRNTRPQIASILFVLGPTLSFSLALHTFGVPDVAYWSILIVLINAAIGWQYGLMAMVLDTAAILLLLPPDPFPIFAVVILWLTGVAEWLASRMLYTVLEWAWSSQQRANLLLEQLRDRQSELNSTVHMLTEASDRLERTSHELSIARTEAEAARKLKEQFAANISHELKTPLNLILGFSEMMYFSPDVYGEMEWPITLTRDIRQIYRNTQQLLGLINDVLDLSRIDAAQMLVRRDLVDLGPILRDVVDTMKDLVRGQTVEIRGEIPASLPVLYVDGVRVRQILINLINNAVRFTDQGEIAVSAKATSQEIIVSVQDTGIGIAPQELPKIFDEFHQADMSLRRKRGGAGLGLSISKRFVEMHDGRIWVTSRLGEGSCFEFALPLPDAPLSLGRLNRSTHLAPQVDQYEVSFVLVERDVEVGEMLRRHLVGYRVLRAENLAQAQALVREWYPRALVVNVPPGSDHDQALEDWARDNLNPKVTLITCSLPSQAWLSRQVGVDKVLAKPISREQLLEALEEFEGADDILIVDDSRDYAQMVIRFLQSAARPYTVRWAADGAEALACVQAKLPDVILLDVAMPGMDGFAFLESLRAAQQQAKVVVFMVTATEISQDLLIRFPGAIELRRNQALSVVETIRYLRGMLQATEPTLPSDGEPASAKAALDVPAWVEKQLPQETPPIQDH